MRPCIHFRISRRSGYLVPDLSVCSPDPHLWLRDYTPTQTPEASAVSSS